MLNRACYGNIWKLSDVLLLSFFFEGKVTKLTQTVAARIIFYLTSLIIFYE
ncbi:hypothetical protein [Staphylococcus aureus]|nr:hypothetical protein [Staphylococcus aureus]